MLVWNGLYNPGIQGYSNIEVQSERSAPDSWCNLKPTRRHHHRLLQFVFIAIWAVGIHKQVKTKAGGNRGVSAASYSEETRHPVLVGLLRWGGNRKKTTPNEEMYVSFRCDLELINLVFETIYFSYCTFLYRVLLCPSVVPYVLVFWCFLTLLYILVFFEPGTFENSSTNFAKIPMWS